MSSTAVSQGVLDLWSESEPSLGVDGVRNVLKQLHVPDIPGLTRLLNKAS